MFSHYSKSAFSSLSAVKGMRDLVAKHRFIQSCGRRVLTTHGYEEIQTNTVEHESVFSRTLGDASEIVSKEMYAFKDRSGKDLVLRPEGTAGVMRHVLETNGLLESQNKKLFYSGPMFRYERPQVGRHRQFHQLGCEFMHKDSAKSSINNYLIDAEVILVARRFLEAALSKEDIIKVQLELNSLGDTADRTKYNGILQEYFSSHSESLSELSKIRLAKNNPLRILDSKEIQDIAIVENAPKFCDHLSKSSRVYFENLKRTLDVLGIGYTVNPLLVRGLDYYSHTCFEFKNQAQVGKSQDTLLAGGRYDQLASILSAKASNIKGVGFACGIERIALLIGDLDERVRRFSQRNKKIGIVPVVGKPNEMSEEEETNLKIYCMELLNNIGKRGDIEVELIGHSNKIDKQMEFLLKNEFSWGVFVGASELAERKVSVKNLADRQTSIISIQDTSEFAF